MNEAILFLERHDYHRPEETTMKFRTLFVLMAVVLMANIAFAYEVKLIDHLTPAMQEQVLTQRAAGNFVAADSLTAVFTAQIQLAAKRAEARKLDIQKQADREAVWTKAVSKRSFEECMQWTASDSTGSQVEKLGWLSKRWVAKYGFKPFDEKATLDEVLDSMWFQVNERRAAAKQRAEIDTRVRAAIEPVTSDLRFMQAQIDAGARADTTMARMLIKATDDIGVLSCQVAELQSKVAQLEAWKPTVDGRLDEIEQSADRVLELMGYAKYSKIDGSPDNADLVRKFVAGK